MYDKVYDKNHHFDTERGDLMARPQVSPALKKLPVSIRLTRTTLGGIRKYADQFYYGNVSYAVERILFMFLTKPRKEAIIEEYAQTKERLAVLQAKMNLKKELEELGWREE